jgi:hypothetical protein
MIAGPAAANLRLSLLGHYPGLEVGGSRLFLVGERPGRPGRGPRLRLRFARVAPVGWSRAGTV